MNNTIRNLRKKYKDFEQFAINNIFCYLFENDLLYKCDDPADTEFYCDADLQLAKYEIDDCKEFIKVVSKVFDDSSISEKLSFLNELFVPSNRFSSYNKGYAKCIADLLEVTVGDNIVELSFGESSTLLNVIIEEIYKNSNKLSDVSVVGKVPYGLLAIMCSVCGIDFTLPYSNSSSASRYMKGFAIAHNSYDKIPVSDEWLSLKNIKYPINPKKAERFKEIYVIDRLIYGMAKGGKSLAVIKGALLFSVKEFFLNLVDKGYLEAVIQCDNNPIGNVVLILSRGNKKVKFYDCTSMDFTKWDSAMYRKYKETVPFEYGFTALLNNDSISMMPAAIALEKKVKDYYKDIKEGTSLNFQKLSDLATIRLASGRTLRHFDGLETVDVYDSFGLITAGCYKDGAVDWDAVTYVRKNEVSNFLGEKNHLVSEGELLLTNKSNSKNVNVMMVEDIPESREIAVIGNMVRIIPNSRELGLYLKLFLESDIGQDVLRTTQKGGLLPIFDIEKLSNVKVPANEYVIRQAVEKHEEIASKLDECKKEITALEKEMLSIYDNSISGCYIFKDKISESETEKIEFYDGVNNVFTEYGLKCNFLCLMVSQDAENLKDIEEDLYNQDLTVKKLSTDIYYLYILCDENSKYSDEEFTSLAQQLFVEYNRKCILVSLYKKGNKYFYKYGKSKFEFEEIESEYSRRMKVIYRFITYALFGKERKVREFFLDEVIAD